MKLFNCLLSKYGYFSVRIIGQGVEVLNIDLIICLKMSM